MKLKSILAALLLLVAGLQTAMAQKMIVTLNDNSQVTYSISQVKEVTFVEADEPVNDEHEYVDLGLPSGTLWATCNVGASKPEEYGDYFAWGETTTKSTYDSSTYKWCNGSSTTVTKYCTQSGYGYNGFTDNLTELQPADDAATANWGSDWQMPSLAQIKELYDSSNTTTEWTQVNGVNGRKITSKSNGNSIFLPAAGYRLGTSLRYAGSLGHYWSRSLDTGNSNGAYYLRFGSGNVGWSNDSRGCGRSVRPVRVSSASPVQLVTSITLSQTSLSLEVGKTQMLTATVSPSDADNKEVEWTSSDESIASVDRSGKVTAKAKGTCIITCSAKDGSGMKAECAVTVIQLVTGITLSETTITLQPDESKRLTATVMPADADNPAVTWTSSNEAVAEVNSSGRVTANAKGTCTITCAATDGSGVKAECQVTVGNTPDEHEYVDLGLPSGTLWATCNVGASKPEEYGDYFAWGETEPMDYYDWSTYFDTDDYGSTFKKYYNNGGKTELLPEDDAATANWGSDWQMPSLAQIEELYNSNYTTRVWTQMNGVYGRKITSKSNGNSIFLPAAGYRYDTSLDCAGSLGGYWSRSLYESESRYAYCLSFDSDYVVWDGDNRYFGNSVRPVRVSPALVQLVTSITLSQTSLSLEVGKTQMLTATVLPSNATNKTVIWTSSNTSVATVSTSGMVTAKAKGTCTITCSAKDGSGMKAECAVTVIQLVTSITLSETSLSLWPDKTQTLTATVQPSNASNKSLTWSSSNTSVATVNQSGKVTAKAKGTCTITCSAKDGSGMKAECQVSVGNEWVDLGLPSGTLWATCNVGANSPEEYGDYFAWGETTTESTYSWITYFDTYDNGNTFKKYNNNGSLTELQLSDDAAAVNWGGNWRMPSLEQIKELYNSSYTTTVWTQLNGVYGRKVTSKSNGNSIFLPAAGYRREASLYFEGSYGGYWSRSLYTSSSVSAYDLYFTSATIDWSYNFRNFGHSVRPVRVLTR